MYAAAAAAAAAAQRERMSRSGGCHPKRDIMQRKDIARTEGGARGVHRVV